MIELDNSKQKLQSMNNMINYQISLHILCALLFYKYGRKNC